MAVRNRSVHPDRPRPDRPQSPACRRPRRRVRRCSRPAPGPRGPAPPRMAGPMPGRDRLPVRRARQVRQVRAGRLPVTEPVRRASGRMIILLARPGPGYRPGRVGRQRGADHRLGGAAPPSPSPVRTTSRPPIDSPRFPARTAVPLPPVVPLRRAPSASGRTLHPPVGPVPLPLMAPPLPTIPTLIPIPALTRPLTPGPGRVPRPPGTVPPARGGW